MSTGTEAMEPRETGEPVPTGEDPPAGGEPAPRTAGAHELRPDPSNSGASRPRSSRIPKWLFTWVPILTSVGSLAISFFTYSVATRLPEVLLILPRGARVVQGGQGPSYLYLQPTFLSTGRSARAEAILGMKLLVQAAGDGAPVEFSWAEQGLMTWDRATQELSWQYSGDAGPLLVSPEQAQMPLATFNAPPGWQWKAGVYRITLVADRAVGKTQLKRAFELVLSQRELQYLNETRDRRFVPLFLRLI